MSTTEPTITERVGRAAAALLSYTDAVALTNRQDHGLAWLRQWSNDAVAELGQDLLTDLRHLADARSLDWTKLADLADMRHDEEAAEGYASNVRTRFSGRDDRDWTDLDDHILGQIAVSPAEVAEFLSHEDDPPELTAEQLREVGSRAYADGDLWKAHADAIRRAVAEVLPSATPAEPTEGRCTTSEDPADAYVYLSARFRFPTESAANAAVDAYQTGDDAAVLWQDADADEVTICEVESLSDAEDSAIYRPSLADLLAATIRAAAESRAGYTPDVPPWLDVIGAGTLNGVPWAVGRSRTDPEMVAVTEGHRSGPWPAELPSLAECEARGIPIISVIGAVAGFLPAEDEEGR